MIVRMGGQDNKCSWLVVQALERASGKQKSIIEVCVRNITAIFEVHCSLSRPTCYAVLYLPMQGSCVLVSVIDGAYYGAFHLAALSDHGV